MRLALESCWAGRIYEGIMINNNRKILEALIAGATKLQNNPLDLLAEHLEAAHRYLLSNSRLEYGMSLAEALKSLSCITDKVERTRIRLAVQQLART